MKYLTLSIILLSIVSCVQEYNINIDSSSSKLVVEGLITDKPNASYVRLTYSAPELLSTYDNGTNSSKIKKENNALVIVSDDQGRRDTLKPAPKYISSANPTDTNQYENSYFQQGYYYLTHLQPKPEHSYFLEIQLNGKNYTSKCFMPSLPKVDTLTFTHSDGIGKGQYYIPKISFINTTGKVGYYLFGSTLNIQGVWDITVLSSELIGDKVDGLDAFKGQANYYWQNAYPTSAWWYDTQMQSLTKEAYEYYQTLIKNYLNDGGTYRPAPAMPQSNVDNGAIGFFRASSTWSFHGIIPQNKK